MLNVLSLQMQRDDNFAASQLDVIIHGLLNMGVSNFSSRDNLRNVLDENLSEKVHLKQPIPAI